mmetsp:Transcript_8721/g.25125  ORF Transcript_8721/g.25125 Transcript_8721/m.25125 type:complete len:219 (-) Transcript_8721:400-1056(-)
MSRPTNNRRPKQKSCSCVFCTGLCDDHRQPLPRNAGSLLYLLGNAPCGVPPVAGRAELLLAEAVSGPGSIFSDPNVPEKAGRLPLRRLSEHSVHVGQKYHTLRLRGLGNMRHHSVATQDSAAEFLVKHTVAMDDGHKRVVQQLGDVVVPRPPHLTSARLPFAHRRHPDCFHAGRDKSIQDVVVKLHDRQPGHHEAPPDARSMEAARGNLGLGGLMVAK